MKIDEVASPWPPVLQDEWEIAEYIESVSSAYVDEDMLIEYFRGCRAILQQIPLPTLTPGNPDQNIPNKRREASFMKMNPATMPPIVVRDNQIEDGNHRYRVAINRGDTEILAYIVTEE